VPRRNSLALRIIRFLRAAVAARLKAHLRLRKRTKETAEPVEPGVIANPRARVTSPGLLWGKITQGGG
jgi:hypothetical protein